MQAASEIEAARETRKRSRLALVLAILAVVLLVALTVLYNVNLRRSQALASAEAGDFDFYISPIEEIEKLSPAHDDQKGSTVSVKAGTSTSDLQTGPTRTPGVGSSSLGRTVGSQASRSRPVYDFRSEKASTPLDAGFREEVATIKPDIPGGSSLSIQPHGVPALVLDDPQEIRDSVRTALKSYNPQIQSCYNKRLLDRPQLKGTWELQFTIQRDGSTSDISVLPSGVSDADLESCMKRKAASWTFQQIFKSQSIEIPYRLGT